MPVVVVESPAKAKTINKYLGDDYTVLASYGHVRDLPPKDGSVDTDADFDMKWEVASDSKKHVKAIADALAQDNALILATDPDREGEAISWHLQEALTKRKSIKKDTPVSRVVFNQITQKAVTEAMQNPRQVDMPLVEAYLARRALDYLVGFNLSPVLWRKLPGAKSAGRVQSVTLRLIVEREMEIEAFRAREYWSVKALLATPRGQEFEARLVSLAGNKLERFDLADATQAEMAVQAITSRALKVMNVEAKPASRNPSAPFMTSTLQQEASRKFSMGARQTMSTAQRLYEAGHITYMRTDGIDMAPEAVSMARDAIKDRFGADYVPKEPRIYKNKAKNAQEAHECIRPTDMTKDAKALKLDADQAKLYDLIWKRTLACQMESARLERTTVEIGSDDAQVGLRANGQVVLFDGFLRVYEEGRDDVVDEDDKRLPQIHQGDAMDKRSVTPEQHFTQPPPRYTEATLVKKMEELGIGRPSTYASIVTTIQDREYVRKDGNRLIPEDKGRLVTAFLENYFRRYIGYDFTADLEDQLDKVSAGDAAYKEVLRRFWRDFSAAIAETSELRITEVLEKINEVLEPHLFPPTEDGSDPRLCPNCEIGRLSMRTARSGGAFIGCSNYPECRYTRPFGPPDPEAEASAIPPDGKLLGEDQGDEIRVFKGRFGPYVQRGPVTEENKKPPRQSIPKDWVPEDLTLEQGVMLLSLPREIGPHPEDGVMVWANIGRYGPYIKHAESTSHRGGTNANLEGIDEVWTVGMNRAVQLLAEKVASRGGRGKAAKPIREMGEHPDMGGAVNVMEGKYGPYVKWEKVNATIPKEIEPADLTMERAVELIEEKLAKSPAKRKAATKKAPAKKTAAKKPAAKKTSTKKAPAKTAAKKPAAKKTTAKKADSA
ncbi:type I DNA topoisomerase [Sulfitobacter sp. KE29]|uniref:type I DNA topoisomerase n=1 Tax=unclassified Sulfitobacter TaxID=196795 RepID=UPI0007C24172|nr:MULTISPECIES: type I DNA topoisomerase [unclassified Sulfitobacter]KZY50142.1 DNA topoisomerase I [Sulfitobacter sp. HI0054]MBO9439874.1 type I DNA topoisomerase [Sulfitobacter sp. R18_2]MDF3418257.1 type I DNA topoisomerase [Sulfitobacter sp. Ks38]MDF3425740.1 type I DNA topoisomerase [Sulfitobacter sp. KE29]MDF3429320.1 type I DNA topoisomerase [Sulfitobacter sp. S46]